MKFYSPKYKQLDCHSQDVPSAVGDLQRYCQLRHYEGLRLIPSVCGQKLIQQTLIN